MLAQPAHSRELFTLLRSSVVRVIAGHASATGFFVSPSLILTCAHALPDPVRQASVHWRGKVLEAHVLGLSTLDDLALLGVDTTRVEVAPACVLLETDAAPGDMMYAYGHPAGDYAANGDSVTFEFEGPSVNEFGKTLLKMKAGQSTPGFSGSPVLNTRTGAVCGVLMTTRDPRSALGGRAIPVSTIFETFPELMNLQAELHDHDRRWVRIQRLYLRTIVSRASASEICFNPYASVPPIPANFVGRHTSVDALRAALLEHRSESRIGAVALHGMGGVGKTVLVAAACRDGHIRAAFPDGIAWTTRDQRKGDRLRSVQAVADALGLSLAVGESFATARSTLQTALADKSALIVLDDVSSTAELETFLIESRNSRLLITTRDSGIADSLSATECMLDTLDEQQSITLLSLWSQSPSESLPLTALEVLKYCGGLPLAIAMCGALARGKPHRWNTVLEDLRSADLGRIAVQFPDYPHPDLLRALAIGVDALSDELKHRYLSLAALPFERPIPQSALAILWGIDARAVTDTVDALTDRSLAIRDAGSAIRMHDLQLQYVRRMEKSCLPEMQRKLIASYRERAKDGWHSGPNDGYFFQSLPYHLAEAGRSKELRELLLDSRWLRAKLQVTDVTEVIADFLLLPSDGDLQPLSRALRLSASVLRHDPSQLASQMKGRLFAHPVVWRTTFLKNLERYERGAILLPTHACLTSSDTPLLNVWHLAVNTSEGHVAFTADSTTALFGIGGRLILWDCRAELTLREMATPRGEILGLAFTPDERFAISSAKDGSVRLWDVSTGAQVRLVDFHQDQWVHPLAFSSDGQFVASGDEAGLVKIVSVYTGTVLAAVQSHAKWAQVVLWIGANVISASPAGTLVRWNLQNGGLITMREAEESYQTGAVAPDHTRFAIGTDTGLLQLWDASSFNLVCSMQGPNKWISAIAFSETGREILCGYGNGMLVLWDLEKARAICALPGHESSVIGVTVTANATRAISGGRDGSLRLWALDGGGTTPNLEAREKASTTAMRTSYSGGLVAAAYSGGKITVHDLNRKLRYAIETGQSWIEDVVITTDNHYIVSGGVCGALQVRELESGKLMHEFRAQPDDVAAVVFTDDGRFGVFGDRAGVVRVWDVFGQIQVQEINAGPGVILTIAVTLDCSRALISVANPGLSTGGTVQLWDMSEGRLLTSVDAYISRGRVLRFMPDPLFAIAGTGGGNIVIWDMTSATLRTQFRGHLNHLSHLVPSRSGNQLLSCSDDRTLRLWDVVTEKIICSFTADNALKCCALAEDSQLIVAGDGYGDLYFLELRGAGVEASSVIRAAGS